MRLSDAIERAENPQAARIEIRLRARAARADAKIGGGAVLAGEEPGRQRIIGNDADLFFQTEVLKLALEIGAIGNRPAMVSQRSASGVEGP